MSYRDQTPRKLQKSDPVGEVGLAGRGLHPLESAAFSRRTWEAVIRPSVVKGARRRPQPVSADTPYRRFRSSEPALIMMCAREGSAEETEILIRMMKSSLLQEEGDEESAIPCRASSSFSILSSESQAWNT